MSNLNKTQESGRSMVEMLGVLAVIGVLSVAGIAGYTTAMNKHRANEILNAASVRAMVVSARLQQNAGADVSNALSEFGSETVVGVGYTAAHTSGATTFTLTLSDVSAEACTQMKNIVGSNANVNIGDCPATKGNLTLTYNADLSAPVTITPTSTPVSCTSGGSECSGCQTCQDGVCKDNNASASCGTDGVCTNGRCTNCPKGDACGTQCCADGTYCAKTGTSDYTCASPSGTGCTKNADCNDTSKYCKMTGSNCSAPATGTCESKGTLTEVSYNGHKFYASADYMTWWAAENFCLAHGKHLASLGSLGLSTDYFYEDPTFDWDTETGEQPGPLYEAFNAKGVANKSYWTSNSYSSCAAYNVAVYSYYEFVDTIGRNDDYSALCE